MAGASRFAPAPPDLSLAFARLEAEHFNIPLIGGLGELVLQTSELPAVQDALAAYTAPAPIELDEDGTTVRVFEMLAADEERVAIGAALGVHERTVRRHLLALFRQHNTTSEADTLRQLIGQGAITPPALEPVQLSPREHLTAILLSRGWTAHHISARSGESALDAKPRLTLKTGLTSLAAITHRLFASKQLALDTDLRQTSAATTAATVRPQPINIRDMRPHPFSKTNPRARAVLPADTTLGLTRIEAARLGITPSIASTVGALVLNTFAKPETKQTLREKMTAPSPQLARELTPRELDIVELYIQDNTTRDVAAILGTGVEGLRTEVATIRLLVGARTNAEAIRKLIEHEVIVPTKLPRRAATLETDDFLVGSLLSRGWTINDFARAIDGVSERDDVQHASKAYRDYPHSLSEWGGLGVTEHPALVWAMFSQGWLLSDTVVLTPRKR